MSVSPLVFLMKNYINLTIGYKAVQGITNIDLSIKTEKENPSYS